MSAFKVRIGDDTLDVDGLGGLIALVKAGRLKPEDPVYIPATGRWHYARSVRQLRDHFAAAGVVAPEPPPPREPEPEPESPPEPEDEGAQILKLRRGQWSPEGKGVDVPIFAFDVDAEPPRSYRIALLLGLGLVIVVSTLVYRLGYSSYERGLKIDRVPTALPGVSGVAVATPRRLSTPAGKATPVIGAGVATPATPAPTALPVFDAGAARSKVVTATLDPVRKPEQLGAAMKKDFTRLAIPIREVSLTADRGPRDQAVPFELRVDYVPADTEDAAHRARARFMIVAMVGRRMNELHLNVAALRVRTLAGALVESSVAVPPEVARGALSGSSSGDDVSRLFAGAK